MVKKLRSLIQEVIPIDLRVEIDLLSRRRDISNAEKQEELFKLLRKYNINDITPLGCGTNRYAFKLNGFVIKVATDHDGVIDNKKEFKMAKRLFPHVIKIYEVSENGTLLVCEYIQPFQSYGEMMQHADQIRGILKELSSVYLIGDVGITRKNYANWGLRVGSDVPVCLDFAYVYEVKSELFICRYCKNNSMLLPNSDFTELYCPAPGCGRKYTFEDIRAKLGNDIHRHEIGDLAEEGYRLTESNVETELTLERSNYLVKKKNTVTIEEEKEPEEKVTPDTFFIPYEEPKQQEENTMSIIKASASIIDSVKGNINLNFVTKVEPKVEPEEKIEKKPLFASSIPITVEAVNDNTDDSSTDINIPVNTENEPAEKSEHIDHKPIFTASVKPTVMEDNKPAPKHELVSESVHHTATKHEPVSAESDEESATSFPKFGKNFAIAVSKFSSRIATWLEEIEAFEEIKNDIKSKNKKFMTSEDIKQLYDNTQRAFYHAITELCDFEKTEATRENGTTFTKYIPGELIGQSYTPTVIFIDRFFNDKSVWNTDTAEEALEKYRSKYRDYHGLQSSFAAILRRRLKSKLFILTDTGVQILANIIIDKWVIDDPAVSDDTPDNDTASEIVDSTEEVSSSADEIADESTAEAPTVDDEAETFSDSEDAATASDEEESSEESYDEDAYPESNYPLKVDIHHDTIGDCVRVTQSDFYGMIAIPFYVNWDSVEPNDPSSNEIHRKNSNWDWLGFLVPDMRFQTKDPDKWMAGNNSYDEQTKIIILDTDDDEQEFLMGVYIVDSINEYDVNGNETNAFNEETVGKLNSLIGGDLAAMHSHFARSVSVDDNIYTEEYMENMLNIQCDDEFVDDGADEADDGSSDMSEQELAAFEALMGANANVQSDDSSEQAADAVPDDSENQSKWEDAGDEPMMLKPIRRKNRNKNRDREFDDER